MSGADPHAGAPIASIGPEPSEAHGLVVAVHGRGASAQSMLDLRRAVDSDGITWWAPQASGFTWYPRGFMAPMQQNEPWLGSALGLLGSIVDTAVESGFRSDRIALMGFSQGACLSLEWAARNPGAIGAVVAFSGGLIGPEGRTFDYGGSFEGTPVFLGCSDVDAHIPVDRVHESAEVLAAMGARVEKRIYPGMPHTVNQDEVDWLSELLRGWSAGDV